jgi:hypothetical protein
VDHVGTHGLQIDVEAPEGPSAGAGSLAKEAEEQMLGPDVCVPQVPSLLLGTDHCFASWVGESLEHRLPTSPTPEPSLGVLLVDRLLGNVELSGDLLPGPPEVPGIVHLKGLELLEEPPKCHDGAKADLWVTAPGRSRQLRGLAHVVNIC